MVNIINNEMFTLVLIVRIPVFYWVLEFSLLITVVFNESLSSS